MPRKRSIAKRKAAPDVIEILDLEDECCEVTSTSTSGRRCSVDTMKKSDGQSKRARPGTGRIGTTGRVLTSPNASPVRVSRYGYIDLHNSFDALRNNGNPDCSTSVPRYLQDSGLKSSTYIPAYVPKHNTSLSDRKPESTRGLFNPLSTPINSPIKHDPAFPVGSPISPAPFQTPNTASNLERVLRTFVSDCSAAHVDGLNYSIPWPSSNDPCFDPTPIVPRNGKAKRRSREAQTAPTTSGINETIDLTITLNDDKDETETEAEVVVLDDTLGEVPPLPLPALVEPVVETTVADNVIDLCMDLEDGELKDDDEVEFVGVQVASINVPCASGSRGSSPRKKMSPQTKSPMSPKKRSRSRRTEQSSATPVQRKRPRKKAGTSKTCTPVSSSAALLARRNTLIMVGNSASKKAQDAVVKALKRLGKTRWGTPLALQRQVTVKNDTVSGWTERKYMQATQLYQQRNAGSRIRGRGGIGRVRNAAASFNFSRLRNIQAGQPGSSLVVRNPVYPIVARPITTFNPFENDNRSDVHPGLPNRVSLLPTLVSGNSAQGNSYETTAGNVPSSFGTNMCVPQVVRRVGDKRPIIIDGSNVAMAHGNNRVFSCRGIKVCADYFKQLGHKTVLAFVPRFRTKFSESVDTRILDELEKDGIVKYTPSREVDGRRIASYDDRYVVQCAAAMGGVIISNDNFRDLLKEEPSWRDVIESRLLQFTWATEDILIFPTDPLGRNGPTLYDFLRY